ncbi:MULTISPECIES: prepilin-type N-terminal cleavage/methylation domain-containing protein [unclassified Psychrobacter]|uniref:type II secretion system protein GspJ n=1 Tax=unclassified Psychrobacter TaxID=196806 RepID=UPI0025B471DE|nr:MULTISPECIES: prepilin-type N-terminal cleavage/methylation domain-containing protein [unclassified Psychrobacter]MDN3452348.1 prepilin-type N-terminal cleavage/methylation domain-containing protein [Psychrobacter sp. APC 3350]MDN3502168.1 prepilin-type N-terminal cleavage/methylation domain-containing protein [Psychrobacter sp. 5A.1]
MRLQRGFTLLELMVAMAIFAMLAVAGWQVFDGVNRARERAQFHADNLAVLQYAYLQLQQDMGQIIPYQIPNTQNVSTANNSASDSDNSNNSTNKTPQSNEQAPVREIVPPEPFMSLDAEHVSFIRFADPDPRYQSSNSIQRIEYIFADERLIRRQYTSVEGGRDSISLDSVLLEGVTAGRWQAYLPEQSTKFPGANSGNNHSTNTASEQTANTASTKPEVLLLPKGMAVDFTYQDMPITWQWALAPQPIPHNSHSSVADNKASDSSDSDKDGNSSNTGNGSVDNSN